MELFSAIASRTLLGSMTISVGFSFWTRDKRQSKIALTFLANKSIGFDGRTDCSS